MDTISNGGISCTVDNTCGDEYVNTYRHSDVSYDTVYEDTGCWIFDYDTNEWGFFEYTEPVTLTDIPITDDIDVPVSGSLDHEDCLLAEPLLTEAEAGILLGPPQLPVSKEYYHNVSHQDFTEIDYSVQDGVEYYEEGYYAEDGQFYYYEYHDNADSHYSEAQNRTQAHLDELSGRSNSCFPHGRHATVCFGFGGKLCLINSGAHPSVELSSTRYLLDHSEFMQLSQRFPGPITLRSSFKEVETAISAEVSKNTSDSQDAILWELLLIVLRAGMSRFASQDEAVTNDIVHILLRSSSSKQDNCTAQSRILLSSQSSLLLSQQESCLLEFEKLVLHGKHLDALSYSLSKGMWTHSLLLASSLGPDVFQSTVTSYAMNVLASGTPLQTLYIMKLSDPALIFRNPEPFQSEQERRSDASLLRYWEDNLAVLLSNQNPVERRCIILELGDTLRLQYNHIHAAHFCYLVAGEMPGPRIGTIGLDILDTIAIDSVSLFRTEILEYALLKDNSHGTIPAFQPYKFVYACLLIDLGLTQKAFDYIKVIEFSVRNTGGREREAYSESFLKNLETISLRLSLLCKSASSHVQDLGSANTVFGSLMNKVSDIFIGQDDDEVKQSDLDPHSIIKGYEQTADTHDDLTLPRNGESDVSCAVDEENDESWILGLFKTRKVPQAILPDENTVHYDEVTKKWSAVPDEVSQHSSRVSPLPVAHARFPTSTLKSRNGFNATKRGVTSRYKLASSN